MFEKQAVASSRNPLVNLCEGHFFDSNRRIVLASLHRTVLQFLPPRADINSSSLSITFLYLIFLVVLYQSVTRAEKNRHFCTLHFLNWFPRIKKCTWWRVNEFTVFHKDKIWFFSCPKCFSSIECNGCITSFGSFNYLLAERLVLFHWFSDFVKRMPTLLKDFVL